MTEAQYRFEIGDDRVVISPSWPRIAMIRILLVGFGGTVAFMAGGNILTGGMGWPQAAMAFAALVGVLLVLIGLLPWRMMHFEADAGGITLRGRRMPLTGTVPWSQVRFLVKRPYTRTSGGETLRQYPMWSIGLLTTDRIFVPIVETQGPERAGRLVAALSGIADSVGVALRVQDRVADLDLDAGATQWPPSPPSGHPRHPALRVEERQEGIAIGPLVAPTKWGVRYIAIAIGMAGLAAAVLWAGHRHFGWFITDHIGHILMVFLAIGLLQATVALILAGWRTLQGPHLHLVTESTLVILDRQGASRRRFRLSDIRRIERAGGTLRIETNDEKSHKLHFESVEDPDALYWAMQALEHAMATLGGWKHDGNRQSRADFDRATGVRISVRTG